MTLDQRVELTELLFGKSVIYIDSLLNGFGTPPPVIAPPVSFSPSLPTRFPSRGNNARMIGPRRLAS